MSEAFLVHIHSSWHNNYVCNYIACTKETLLENCGQLILDLYPLEDDQMVERLEEISGISDIPESGRTRYTIVDKSDEQIEISIEPIALESTIHVAHAFYQRISKYVSPKRKTGACFFMVANSAIKKDRIVEQIVQFNQNFAVETDESNIETYSINPKNLREMKTIELGDTVEEARE